MAKLDPETENNMDELIRAAEAGNAAAQTHLGWCYDEGEGVEVDHEKSFCWYSKAAAPGYPEARKVWKKLEATKNEP